MALYTNMPVTKTANSAPAYKVVIEVPMNGTTRYFTLDTCTARTLTSDATIAQFPIQEGVVASDHMYRNPRQFTLNGSFSMNGSHAIDGDLYTIGHLIGSAGDAHDRPWDEWLADNPELKNFGEGNRLRSIQNLFEWIQAKGVRVKIMMRETSLNARFKIRDNMALKSISWQEEFNSMRYTLGFSEVITVTDFFNPESFEWFSYGDLYPSPVNPATKTLAEVLQDKGAIGATVIKALLDEDFLVKADGVAFTLLNAARTALDIWGVAVAASLAAAVAAGLVAAGVAITGAVSSALSAVAGTAATLSVAGPVGWAILAGAVIITGIVIGIVAAIQSAKKRRRLQQGFNLVYDYETYVKKNGEPTGADIQNARNNAVDVARLENLLNYVATQIDGITNGIRVYEITNDMTDDADRDFPLVIGQEILYARIETLKTVRGNTPYKFKLRLFDGPGENAREILSHAPWPICTNLSQMSRNGPSVYISPDGNYECYLYCPAADPEVQERVKSLSVKEAAAIIENGEESSFLAASPASQILSNYYFVVSEGRIEKKVKDMENTIVRAVIDYLDPAD